VEVATFWGYCYACLWFIHGLSLWGSHAIYVASQGFADVVSMFVIGKRGAFTLHCCTFTFSFPLICTFFFCGQSLDDCLIKFSSIIQKKKKKSFS
jgi:hypothetical protein